MTPPPRLLTIRPRLCIVSLIAWVAALAACGRAEQAADAPARAAPVAAAAPVLPPEANGVGFRSERHLADHYRKHGREFAGLDQAGYLRAAQRLRDTTVGGAILEVTRPDGTISRFDRTSGAFVAFDPDGTLRTFFKPNDGEGYFRRQARRSQR